MTTDQAEQDDDVPSDELWALVDALKDQLAKHVVPIFRDDEKGRPELLGSGLLVAARQGSFLVSAAHVLDPVRTDEPLYLHPRPGCKLRLAGRHFLTLPDAGGDRKRDGLDVGVLRLEGTAAPPYPEVGKLPLPVEALVPGAIPRQRKQYLALGFPSRKSKVDVARKEVEARLYSSLCRSAPAERYAELGISTSSHIVLEFNRKRVLERDGQRRSFPNPEGMSGSPLWVLWDTQGKNDPSFTPAVGILVEHPISGQVLVATDVMFVLELIRLGF